MHCIERLSRLSFAEPCVYISWTKSSCYHLSYSSKRAGIKVILPYVSGNKTFLESHNTSLSAMKKPCCGLLDTEDEKCVLFLCIHLLPKQTALPVSCIPHWLASFCLCWESNQQEQWLSTAWSCQSWVNSLKREHGERQLKSNTKTTVVWEQRDQDSSSCGAAKWLCDSIFSSMLWRD